MFHTGASPHDDRDSTTNEAGSYFTREASFAENRDVRSDTSSTSTATFRGLQGFDNIDARFSERPPAYYQPGRVFAMLWDEQDIEPQMMDIIAPGTVNLSGNKGSLGSQTSSSVHTMVVVQAHSGYCECIQVDTYGQRGLVKFIHSPKDVNAHAVIYVDGTAPHLLYNEPSSNKRPIAIKKTNPEQNLAESSRLHYTRVYNVQYTAKTIDIGYVGESLPDLLRDFQTVNGLSGYTLPKEGRKLSSGLLKEERKPSDELPKEEGKPSNKRRNLDKVTPIFVI
ncbi:hypothetical protein AYO20_05874 [Fonsecaea nubica]|uniref:DUF6590 domain-containing protein n=1 Tax=Fonsecaea nubica TaxID=856822 RepID=A0A178D0K1_9EURO|nr:hypothetical protein AYO20_05874 [Fonsecaea nubica]OAL34913.1 hypothetical protein AYO20_05874 [Fonsecaea nubica]